MFRLLMLEYLFRNNLSRNQKEENFHLGDNLVYVKLVLMLYTLILQVQDNKSGKSFLRVYGTIF